MDIHFSQEGTNLGMETYVYCIDTHLSQEGIPKSEE